MADCIVDLSESWTFNLPVEASPKVLKAGLTDPVLAVFNRPAFQLSVQIILEHMIAEVDPTEVAMVMFQLGVVS